MPNVHSSFRFSLVLLCLLTPSLGVPSREGVGVPMIVEISNLREADQAIFQKIGITASSTLAISLNNGAEQAVALWVSRLPLCVGRPYTTARSYIDEEGYLIGSFLQKGLAIPLDKELVIPKHSLAFDKLWPLEHKLVLDLIRILRCDVGYVATFTGGTEQMSILSTADDQNMVYVAVGISRDRATWERKKHAVVVKNQLHGLEEGEEEFLVLDKVFWDDLGARRERRKEADALNLKTRFLTKWDYLDKNLFRPRLFSYQDVRIDKGDIEVCD